MIIFPHLLELERTRRPLLGYVIAHSILFLRFPIVRVVRVFVPGRLGCFPFLPSFLCKRFHCHRIERRTLRPNLTTPMQQPLVLRFLQLFKPRFAHFCVIVLYMVFVFPGSEVTLHLYFVVFA